MANRMDKTSTLPSSAAPCPQQETLPLSAPLDSSISMSRMTTSSEREANSCARHHVEIDVDEIEAALAVQGGSERKAAATLPAQENTSTSNGQLKKPPPAQPPSSTSSSTSKLACDKSSKMAAMAPTVASIPFVEDDDLSSRASTASSIHCNNYYDDPYIPSHMANALMEGLQPMPNHHLSNQNGNEKRYLDDNGFDIRTPGAHAVGGRPPFASPTCSRIQTSSPFISSTAAQHASTEDEELALSANVVEEGVDPRAMGNSSGNHTRQHLRRTPLEVIEGKAIPSSSDPSASSSTKESKWVYLFMVVLALGAAVLMVMILILQGNKNDTSAPPSSIPAAVTLSPTTTTARQRVDYPPFQDDLPADILADLQQDPDSPTAKANAWMNNDPHLERYSKGRQRQRFAFVTFYHATGGPDWLHQDHWLDYTVSECRWYSSFDPLHNNAYPAIYDDARICDDDENLLVFDLHGNNLRGLLPGLTHFYPKLRYMDVSDNHLYGPPPLLASKLTDLEAFIISNNQLEGQLVGDAGFVAFNVRIVKMDSNAISAHLNPVFRVMPKLQVMNITSNQFHMHVGTELAYTPDMIYLGMADNQLYGSLPSEVGTLANLKTLDLANNAALTGSIPSEWSHLEELALLDLSGTSLTGAIPSALCDQQQKDTALEILANCSHMDCCQL
ncbi:Leucine Rich Repeat [Seminavis robusta]|uniref:Leucine Rich Repeat n=1 Tax=Seminavis robusta TaxID=568900 RepID=A0A9N8EWS4_9STRA|nr:Leucine Rich Repeat [Seminavis robusta]|eukprot:Sro1928_g306040.1 Leucine Rich Repeat (673) ;mRNA; r:12523-14541